VQDCTIMIGLYIVFVHYWKRTKPTFVKVIWVLLLLLCAMNVLKLYAHREAIHNDDDDKKRRYQQVYNWMTNLSDAVSQLVHWQFVVEYYAAVLKFPWLAAADDDDDEALEKRMKWIKCKLMAANALFYSLVLGFLLYALIDQTPLNNTNKHLFFDACNKAISAVLLIYSLAKFSRNIKTMKSKEFFTSERLMKVHLAIFALFILAYLAILVIIFLNNKYWYIVDGNVKQAFCRAFIAQEFFFNLMMVSGYAMVVLFIYLSVKFSEPLKDY